MVKRQHIINLLNQETDVSFPFSFLAFPDVTLVLIENIEYLELDKDDQDNIIEEGYTICEDKDVFVENDYASRTINKLHSMPDQNLDSLNVEESSPLKNKDKYDKNIVDDDKDITKPIQKKLTLPQNTDTNMMYHVPRKGMTFSDMDEAKMFLYNFSMNFSPHWLFAGTKRRITGRLEIN